jgi:hypothetical protein
LNDKAGVARSYSATRDAERSDDLSIIRLDYPLDIPDIVGTSLSGPG